MPRTHPPYSPEFRRQMVDLVRAGRDPDDLAREFEESPYAPTMSVRPIWPCLLIPLALDRPLHSFLGRQADRNEGRRAELPPGLSAAEREELIRLRRENKQLRLERDILSKATASSIEIV